MILDETMSLRFSVSSGTDVVFHSSYVTDTGTAITAAALVGESNGATAVVIAAAPGAGEKRTIESVSIYNQGTGSQTTTITTSDGTVRTIYASTIGPGESIAYDRGSGRWVTLDRQGRERRDPIASGLTGTTRALFKTGTASDAAAYWICTAKDAGIPGAITVGTPGVAGRAVTGSTEGGTIALPTPSGNWHLTHANITSTVAHWHMLFDLLWINSGITVTTTTAQTVNSVALPARDAQGTTNGEGCLIGMLVTTVIANAAINNTATVSYTNSAGTAGRTATLINVAGAMIPATAVVGTIVWFHLEAGDTGVRSIQSVTLATTFVSGAVSFLIARPLVALPNPIVNVGSVASIEPDPGICVWDNPAILHCYQSSATTATTLAATLQFVDRA